jgi:hypothetical protein
MDNEKLAPRLKSAMKKRKEGRRKQIKYIEFSASNQDSTIRLGANTFYFCLSKVDRAFIELAAF